MISAKTKKWGNSLGLLIPAGEVRRLGLNEDQEVTIEIQEKINPLQELFGFGKNKKIGNEEFKEFRKELESKWV